MVTNSITRRDFVRTTAAAGAGLLLASGTRALAQTDPAAGKKLNVALIGFGAQGGVVLYWVVLF